VIPVPHKPGEGHAAAGAWSVPPTLSLEQQIGSDGATWLDHELVAHGCVPVDATGFGREVAEGLERRAERLAEMGHAKRQPDGLYLLPRNLLAALERREVEVTYPSNASLTYTYTSLGYAQQVTGLGGQVHWNANAHDAELRLTQQTAGNGVVTSQGFDPQTGRLTAILAGTGNIVENFSYTYDVLGNVLTRADTNENLTETFTYDALNRMTSATVSQNIAPVAYDAIGNLLSKSDVGTYTYPLAGSARPHAVTSISGGGTRRFWSKLPARFLRLVAHLGSTGPAQRWSYRRCGRDPPLSGGRVVPGSRGQQNAARMDSRVDSAGGRVGPSIAV
jgi:hypothetical protein